MPSARSPSGGLAGAGRRRCTRADLLTAAFAVTLCSATYCFSVWHNGRNAPDKIILGPAPFVVVGATLCGRDAATSAVDAATELDFEARHTAEKAGLSVSSTTATSISGRRALSTAAAAPVDAGRRGRSPWPASSARGTEGASGDKGWPRVDEDKITFTHAGAARA